MTIIVTLIRRLKRVDGSQHLMTTRPLFTGWSLVISQARIQDEAQMDNALPNSSNKLRQGNDRATATTVTYETLQSTSYESSSLQALKQSF
jgi:hypothetical protein